MLRTLAGCLIAGGLGGAVWAQQPPDQVPTLPPLRVIGDLQQGSAQPDDKSGKGQPGPGEGEGSLGPPAPPATSVDNSRSAPPSNVIGSAPSASEGRINQLDIADQPFLRPTDILELVPGLQIGNHAGTIKASEYLLRGFYLDNGTDISATIDDVPYNKPNNPHLHGYLDLNMLIPELVQYIQFQKGPYYAENGDFSLAASMHISMVDSLPYGIFKTEAGKDAYFRELIADSGRLGQGTLLYAFEAKYYNGPWDLPNNARQFNGILRYTLGDEQNGLRVTAWGYSAVGRTEDAVSDLAVQAGAISRFGTFDPALMLSTQREQLNTQWWHQNDAGDLTKANLYYVYSRFNIFSNSTGTLLDDQAGNFGPDGSSINDTVQQYEESSTFGANISQSFNSRLFGDNVRDTFGFQSRYDNIPRIIVNHAPNGIVENNIDDQSVIESNLALYWTNECKWGPKVRTVLGVRGDYFHWNVDDYALGDANSGKTESKLIEPKGSLILGPWANTEFYLNGGYGFHSNAAGGIFANNSSDFIQGPAGAVPNPNGLATPLARGRGAEVGLKSAIIPGLTTTAALWYLRLESELIFDPVGDTGVPRGASERYGVELSNTYHLNPWLTVNADWSASQAHFLSPDPATGGTDVDQAIGILASIGPTIRVPEGYFTSLRYKYIGPRNLIPDGSLTSTPVNEVSLSAGYEGQRLGYGVELLNLFNYKGPDAMFAVDTAVNGTAFLGGTTSHPLEPFQARFYLTLKF